MRDNERAYLCEKQRRELLEEMRVAAERQILRDTERAAWEAMKPKVPPIAPIETLKRVEGRVIS